MREDELPLLREVKNFFGCGNIYFQKDKRPNHRNGYRFEISSKQKISEVVIPFFKKYPLHGTGRKNDFKIFCKIFSLTKDRKHLEAKDAEEIKKLKDKMHK